MEQQPQNKKQAAPSFIFEKGIIFYLKLHVNGGDDWLNEPTIGQNRINGQFYGYCKFVPDQNRWVRRMLFAVFLLN